MQVEAIIIQEKERVEKYHKEGYRGEEENVGRDRHYIYRGKKESRKKEKTSKKFKQIWMETLEREKEENVCNDHH